MMRFYFICLLLYVYFFNRIYGALPHDGGTPCYDEQGKPQRCIPQFENAAFGLEVEATNTCGENGPTTFCVQTGIDATSDPCDICGPGDHKSSYMTDYSGYGNRTWWQSETMYEDIQNVNLTIHFGKVFDITYFRLLFESPRPESLAVFKRVTEDGPWIPLQYYSSNCMARYGLPDRSYVLPGEPETKALCTGEFSGLSPISGGNIPFASLEGRPSALQYDVKPELWEWVSATDIMISLDRLNTFGDEYFKDPKTLRSYFYAISDFAVGARCKCNGHASDCVKVSSYDNRVRRVCRCQHNTAGPDCNQCLPFYNDAPWRRASRDDAYECQACNCNGFSDRCFFDQELYKQTGHGGHCLECANNRDGPNCERCRPNYYHPAGASHCEPCNCNETGSWNLQCDSEGKCLCKSGVSGEKCDVCKDNFYEFSEEGCKACNCDVAGSYNNTTKCNPHDGTCLCKENVEGKECSSCKPGFFNLDLSNEFGCTPCFCYGHSSVCQSASNYFQAFIQSSFTRGTERWSAQDETGRIIPLKHNNSHLALEATALGSEAVYFIASERYLGDQKASYNHDLTFKLWTGDSMPIPTIYDVIIEGSSQTISQMIFGQGNRLPSLMMTEYKFRLHEHSKYGWQPKVSARDFIGILSNITSIKIRATYSTQGSGFLKDVLMVTARRGAAEPRADWIEMCTCPSGYVGQFCESCVPGSRHDPVSGKAFSPCVPCNCNGHADICDADTGRCICEHNTAGDNCERCASGYYGNSLLGTVNDCKPCPCPNRGACLQVGDDDTVVCLQCPAGYSGPRCDVCSDGYFGDPVGKYGPVKICEACDCNLNVDANAIGNCNRSTGQCLKCIYNTGGDHCDRCLPGFYGDALALPKGDCKPCTCYPIGTLELDSGISACDQLTGHCHCKSHVTGKNCDQCEQGYFNIISGQGCDSCDCDPVGSVNGTCEDITGKCLCKPGVTGQRCNMCLPNYYGFSNDGCKPCECDIIGSISLQCDAFGQCPCFENVDGRRCDRCKENKWDRQRGCVDCPVCYNLVKDAVDSQRANLVLLTGVIANISNSATIINDDEFEAQLKDVYSRVDSLAADIHAATGGDDRAITGKLAELYKQLNDINELSKQTTNWTKTAEKSADYADANVTDAEQIIDHSKSILQNSVDYLKTDGEAALAKATSKSAEVGEQSEQMSKIARTARELVQRQEEEADQLRATAKKALNVSTQAYELARNAIEKQQNISDELKLLNSTLIFMSEKLNVTADQASDTTDSVNIVHAEALNIYRDAYALNVPNVDSVTMKADAMNISNVAVQLAEESQKLLQENSAVLKDIKVNVKEAEELLLRGIQQQKTANELLSDATRANERADEALKLGDKTLQEAQNTYDTLQEFDKQVQNSKEKAQESLKKIPEIERVMEEAKSKTKNAQQALVGAENNAMSARTIAQEAEQKYAQIASKEADKIREEAERTKAEASRLKEEADALSGRVRDTSRDVDSLNEKANSDQITINKAKEKVGQAKSNAAVVKKQAEEAAEEITKIIKELSNLPEIDEDSLTELEERLEKAQKAFEKSRIDEELEKINQARIQQAQRIKTYQDELSKLKDEVENVSNIRKALPVGCFKRARLEP